MNTINDKLSVFAIATHRLLILSRENESLLGARILEPGELLSGKIEGLAWTPPDRVDRGVTFRMRPHLLKRVYLIDPRTNETTLSLTRRLQTLIYNGIILVTENGSLVERN